ncbi:PAS domain S-box protein [Methylocella sp.]|uniref:PAS domain S-box protein n=1 Tax=Methylocella sp. TaxID=1978226 RepID=UPI003783841B
MPIDLPPQRPSPWRPMAAAALAAGIFLFDTLSPLGIAIAVLYALVVILSAGFVDRRGVLVIAAICMALTIVSFLVGHAHAPMLDATVRCAVSLCAIASTGFLVAKDLEATTHLRRQAALLELTHDAIFVTDAKGAVAYWNPGAEALYGWSAAEAMGQDAGALLRTADAGVRAGVDAALARDGRWRGEFTRRRKDGSTAIVASRLSLHRDERGRAAAVMETSNDVTERKRADDRLREAEQELRRVVDTIPALVWTSSPGRGEIDSINARWRDLGWTFDDVGGPGWRVMVHPDDLGRIDAGWAAALASGASYEDMARIRDASGECRRMVIRAAPLHDGAGAVKRWYGVASDVEDQMRAEESLSRVQAELSHMARVTTLGELAASIAHEVNQPLASVVTNGEAGLRWLSRDPPRLDAVRASLEKTIAGARRASEVVARLRALARRSEPERRPVDLNGLIEETLGLLQREIERHGAKLELRLAPTPPVPGDRVQLQQVVINLAMNALQAMDGVDGRARVLTIAAGAERRDGGETVLAEIADTGVGLGGAEAAKLFDAFYTTKGDGLGMGLSICRSIVEAHGGRIEAQANGAAGAKFRLVLPVEAEGART